MEKAAVTSICWLPRGRCKIRKAEDEDDEDDEQEQTAAASSSAVPATSSHGNGRSASAGAAVNMEGLEEFDLDKYDDDSDNDGGMQFFSVLNNDGELAKEKDPHLKGDPDSDSDSDGLDDIGPQDQVFFAASCEEDSCTLELYVFDEEEASMFVHHDLMLGAYPLCVEWLQKTSSADDGCFAAVGSIDHSIQIWDMDLLGEMEPCQILGPVKKSKKGKAGKTKRKTPSITGPVAHGGPVLCLHGSTFNRSVLVSGSADETVKVWDVSENACVHTYKHHSNKVQCVRWHPTEQAVLLSAAFDKNLALMDVRQPEQVALASLPAEAESAIWSRHRPFECLVSVDNGGVTCYDVRKVASKASDEQKVVWTLLAHDVACTAVQDAPTPNLLVTCGLDGEAKVWNTAGPGPSLVFSKNLKAGPLFACASNPEADALMCFGGSCPVMWDLTSESVLVDAFKFKGDGKVA